MHTFHYCELSHSTQPSGNYWNNEVYLQLQINMSVWRLGIELSLTQPDNY